MQFIDLKAQYQALKPEIDRNIEEVLQGAAFIGGRYVKELERRLAEFIGRKHAVTCASGTDALTLSCMMIGIGEKDAVFCPDITFVATAEPAKMFGASIIFCDVDPDTYNLLPESLENQIKAVIEDGRQTPKAVFAVDILGNPADYDAIVPICKKYHLTLIEDAAQSFGASYKGRRCGNFGDIAITSFFPAKPLGCYGDGGALFTDDSAYDSLCRSLCVHGKGPKGKYDNLRVGMNSRLDSIQAAVLLPKLKALQNHELEDRVRVARRYNAAFEGKLKIPSVLPGCVSAWAQYALLAPDRQKRDAIVSYLTQKGIPNMIYYPSAQHALPVFRDEPHYAENFRNSIDYCARTFSLPMSPYLSKEDQDTVIRAVLEAL